MATSVAAAAPAKLNLTLQVLGPRGDGYHAIRSLVIGVDLADRVICARSHRDGMDLTCSEPGLRGPENLAARAAVALSRRLRQPPAVRIALEKRIPVGAGMGGGSSDAAATLRACNALWSAGLTDEALADVGVEIGSDVPLFFALPAALVSGRGEQVAPVAMRWGGWVLLVHTGVPVPTAPVYAGWQPAADRRDPEAAGRIAASGTAAEIMSLAFNDLEPSVFSLAPAVASAFGAIERAGLGPVRVTGAGATLFRLFDRREEAEAVGRAISELNINVSTSIVAAPAGPGRLQVQE